jgi:hypothetical protein
MGAMPRNAFLIVRITSVINLSYIGSQIQFDLRIVFEMGDDNLQSVKMGNYRSS